MDSVALPTASIKFFSKTLSHWGFGLSVQEKCPLDFDGTPIPWFSYPAIHYIQGLDLSEKSLFEFGGGNSTMFWASVCREVTTVESSVEWGEILRKQIPANVTLHVKLDEPSYLDVMLKSGRLYDIIVIDGDDSVVSRCKTAEAAIAHLAPGGVIILDNSDVHVYSAKILRNADLIQADMTGFVPGEHCVNATSFFFHRECRLKPREQCQPIKFIGSMYHISHS